MRVTEAMVLRKTFGLTRKEVAGGWRKLHNKELHNLYISPNIISDKIKGDQMGEACSMHGRYEKCIQYTGWKM
jgi:hypothetical protein